MVVGYGTNSYRPDKSVSKKNYLKYVKFIQIKKVFFFIKDVTILLVV